MRLNKMSLFLKRNLNTGNVRTMSWNKKDQIVQVTLSLKTKTPGQVWLQIFFTRSKEIENLMMKDEETMGRFAIYNFGMATTPEFIKCLILFYNRLQWLNCEWIYLLNAEKCSHYFLDPCPWPHHRESDNNQITIRWQLMEQQQV